MPNTLTIYYMHVVHWMHDGNLATSSRAVESELGWDEFLMGPAKDRLCHIADTQVGIDLIRAFHVHTEASRLYGGAGLTMRAKTFQPEEIRAITGRLKEPIMPNTLTISTEFDGQHKDWSYPDEWHELIEYLDDLDEAIFPEHNDPGGKLYMQVKDMADNVIADGDRHRYLVLAVDETRDVTVDFKRDQV